MLKSIILLLFAAIVISLFSGLWFLLQDQSRSQRTVNSLIIRVSLASVLLLLLIYGFYSGEISLRSPFPVPTS
ncbi:DUF2909 domain-containing protein [Amphritea sp. HPY]|uniref:DUF2909 domain-containing protein n=1 Tax=Amphritea sp. HPY TaxID=3421652 RepID=UPI003D7D6063